MKKIIFLFLITGIILSCKNTPSGEMAEVSQAADEVSQAGSGIIYNVDLEASLLNYEGSKPTGKHFGTVNFKSGMFTFDAGTVTSGSVVFDMNTIDDKSVTGDSKQKLDGHLKSDDFFDVANFPEAKFEFISMEPLENPREGFTHTFTGNMTIKGITHQLSFRVEMEENGDQVIIEAPQFVFDRTIFDIKYNSGKFFSDLKDRLINDDIGISFRMVANKI
jgi:polyisoprenoid-binding protein YceI